MQKSQWKLIWLGLITFILALIVNYIWVNDLWLDRPALEPIFEQLDSPENAEILFLILFFPIFSIPIVFARQFIGMRTFGLFLPLVVAFTMVEFGVAVGLASYGLLIPIGIISDRFLSDISMLTGSRRSIGLFIIGMSAAVFYILLISRGIEAALLGVPFIIMVTLIEKFNNLVDEKSISEAISILLQTILLAAAIALLYRLFDFEPSATQVFYIFAVAFVVNIILSMYQGSRLLEYVRFKGLVKKGGLDSFMGMNYRNQQLIKRCNTQATIKLVTDKVAYKQLLDAYKIPTTTLLATISDANTHTIEDVLATTPVPFVIKPANGYAGKGIIIIETKTKTGYTDISGSTWSTSQVANHINKIVNGQFSQDDDSGFYDVAMIERKLVSADFMNDISGGLGLPDIRIIYYRNQPIAAMMRVPTEKSQGKANISMGAIGVAIDLDSGELLAAVDAKAKPVDVEYLGTTLPQWQEAVDIGGRAVKISGLGYGGVDIVYDQEHGPIIMECNAQPGLEIQNITGINLFDEVQKVDQEQS